MFHRACGWILDPHAVRYLILASLLCALSPNLVLVTLRPAACALPARCQKAVQSLFLSEGKLHAVCTACMSQRGVSSCSAAQARRVNMQTHPALHACDAPACMACNRCLACACHASTVRERPGAHPARQRQGSAEVHHNTPMGSRTCMYSGKPKQKWAPMPNVAIACAHSSAARCDAQPVARSGDDECAAEYCNMLRFQSQQWKLSWITDAVLSCISVPTKQQVRTQSCLGQRGVKAGAESRVCIL